MDSKFVLLDRVHNNNRDVNEMLLFCLNVHLPILKGVDLYVEYHCRRVNLKLKDLTISCCGGSLIREKIRAIGTLKLQKINVFLTLDWKC